MDAHTHTHLDGYVCVCSIVAHVKLIEKNQLAQHTPAHPLAGNGE